MTTREIPRAGQTYRYAVTPADIEAGARVDPYDCPVALAIKRRHGLMGDRISVGFSAYYKNAARKRTTRQARLPGRVDQFVTDFDHRRPVKPIQFSLTWRMS